MAKGIIENLVAKTNSRAASMLCASILICSGVYMCSADIRATGSINIKAAFLEGQIESGSLGLMAMFLGTVIVIVLNMHRPFKGQEIKILVNGNEITGNGLSFRKIQELVNALSTEQIQTEKTEAKTLPNKPMQPDAAEPRL